MFLISRFGARQPPIPVDDTKVPEMPSKFDKNFLRHIANIKEFTERHQGKLPIGWYFAGEGRDPANPSPDMSARVSYTQLRKNIKVKKNIATWQLKLLDEVGMTRDNDGIFQRDPSGFLDLQGAIWKDCLRQLAEYRNSHKHCNIPKNYSENTHLATWVANQRKQYKLHLKKKPSQMTLSRIQELERLDFQWDSRSATWDGLLSELAAFRETHKHCNVPRSYSKNIKLAHWVANQKKQYRLHQKGKTSFMTTYRIQELESLGFFE
jgi:hypothetical protein